MGISIPYFFPNLMGFISLFIFYSLNEGHRYNSKNALVTYPRYVTLLPSSNGPCHQGLRRMLPIDADMEGSTREIFFCINISHIQPVPHKSLFSPKLWLSSAIFQLGESRFGKKISSSDPDFTRQLLHKRASLLFQLQLLSIFL
jgi:hypothetical protein